YKKLVQTCHPQKCTAISDQEQKKNARKFKEINEALTVLSSPKLRNIYDQFGYSGLRKLVNFDYSKVDPNETFQSFSGTNNIEA
ncbi:MAG: hypothetical protein MHPSP_004612, partial [Paramarteilia canceri]